MKIFIDKIGVPTMKRQTKENNVAIDLQRKQKMMSGRAGHVSSGGACCPPVVRRRIFFISNEWRASRLLLFERRNCCFTTLSLKKQWTSFSPLNEIQRIRFRAVKGVVGWWIQRQGRRCRGTLRAEKLGAPQI